ncbi:MAG TPA: sulfotransferase [Candidatus Limnocylindrales bacterium]|nr:sulfotransferase [Candidatus Limnocylindrales bacterium]
MSRDFVTVVSGLPRSGTSMMMRMLAAGGIEPVSDGLRSADEDNPRGYFELERVKKLPDDSEWLAQAVGRSVKVISALLEKLPASYRYRVLFVEREMSEVLASQRRMLERRGEPQRVPDEAMAAMFRKHLDALRQRLKSRADMQVMFMRYDEVVADPRAAAGRIGEFLGGGLDEEAMAQAVDASLYRQRAASSAQR